MSTWRWQTYLAANPSEEAVGEALWNRMDIVQRAEYIADELSWATALFQGHQSDSTGGWPSVALEWIDWMKLSPGVRLQLIHDSRRKADHTSGVATNKDDLVKMLPTLLVNYATGGVSAGFQDTPAFRTLYWNGADKIETLYEGLQTAVTGGTQTGVGNNLGGGTTATTGGSSAGASSSGGAGIGLLLLGALLLFGGKK